MNKICPRGHEYPEENPYCARNECLTHEIRKVVEYPAIPSGIHTYIAGYKYPYKGYPDPNVVGQTASVKRAVMSSLRLATKSPFRYAVPLFFVLPPFLKRKAFKYLVFWLAELYEADFEKKQLYPDAKFCDMCREFLRALREVTRGIEEPEYRHRIDQAIYCVVMFLEFDSAYRFRAQDILPLINKEALKKNARKEIVRVMREGMRRDNSIPEKWKIISWIANMALFFSPMVRNALRDIFLELDMEKVAFDKYDLYFIADRFDYNFMGKTYWERIGIREKENEGWVEESVDPNTEASIALYPNPLFYKLTREKAEEMAESVRLQILKAHEEKTSKS